MPLALGLWSGLAGPSDPSARASSSVKGEGVVPRPPGGDPIKQKAFGSQASPSRTRRPKPVQSSSRAVRQCKSARITYHVSSVLSQQRKTSRAPRSPSPRPRQKRPILPGLTSEWCLSPELAPRFVPVPDSRVRRPLSVASRSRLCSFFDRWPAAWSSFERLSNFCFRDSQVSRSIRKHCASRCLAFLIPHPPPPRLQPRLTTTPTTPTPSSSTGAAEDGGLASFACALTCHRVQSPILCSYLPLPVTQAHDQLPQLR